MGKFYISYWQYIEQEVKKWDELHILMNKGKYTADNKE